jgi:hypothetical protein
MNAPTMKAKHQDGDPFDSSNSISSGTTSNLQVITKLETNDVLMGRGSCAIRNVGNVRFRELIATRKQEYTRAGRNCAKQKIAKEIVAEISLRKGRFIRQAKPQESQALGISQGTEAWVLADNAVALEKVKQALREKVPIDTFDSSNHVCPYSAPVDYSHQLQNQNLLRMGPFTQTPQWTTHGVFNPSLYALDELFPTSAVFNPSLYALDELFPTSACSQPRLESALIAIALGVTTTTPSMSVPPHTPNESIPKPTPPPTVLDLRDFGRPNLLHYPNVCHGSLPLDVMQFVAQRVAPPGLSAAKRNHFTAPLEGNLSKKRKV